MTVNELIALLQPVPPERRDLPLEVDDDIVYPSGEEGAEDWIVSPEVVGIGLPKPGNRQYVALKIVG